MGKAIHWELCKKLKFHHTWYMLKPEAVLKKLDIWDSEIWTDYSVLVRRPDLVL